MTRSGTANTRPSDADPAKIRVFRREVIPFQDTASNKGASPSKSERSFKLKLTVPTKSKRPTAPTKSKRRSKAK